MRVIILTDRKALGESLSRIVLPTLNPPPKAMTYEESLPFLNTLLTSGDFFILDLFRRYGGYFRAEGIALAKRIPATAGFLIISPLFLAERIRCPVYWDVSSHDILSERIRSLVERPRRCRTNFTLLEQQFQQQLSLPKQHDH